MSKDDTVAIRVSRDLVQWLKKHYVEEEGTYYGHIREAVDDGIRLKISKIKEQNERY